MKTGAVLYLEISQKSFLSVRQEELDGPTVSALGPIAEVKQCWSVIGWETKNLLSLSGKGENFLRVA
jgi:hypothetical protein